MEDKEEILERIHLLENQGSAINIQIKNHELNIQKLNVEIQDRIKWKHFIWIVGIIFMFMGIILGAIYVQVKENGETTKNNNISVSRIEGILENARIDKLIF